MAWPLALKAAMLHGIVVIDAFLVASLGERALAAMGLAGAVGGLLLGILFAFSNATQIRIAQAFGSAGPVALKTGFYCGLVINLLATMVGLSVVLIFGQPLIAHFAQTEWIAQQASSYLAVFLFVVLGEAVAQCFASHFNGCGKTKMPFLSYLITLPVNVGVSIVLIHGMYGMPALGVVGAAYGTVVASTLRATYLGVLFLRENGGFLDIVGWSQGRFRDALRRHFIFSWPIAATFVSVVLGNQACMLIYANMTVVQFAAMTLVLPWVNVLGVFGMAWAQATGICIAQLLGRGASEPVIDEFLARAWRGAFVAAGIVATIYLLFILLSGWMYHNLQDETRALLWLFLPLLLVLPFPKGSNAICGQTLRAAGDTVRVMNIMASGQWVIKVPLTFVFVVVFGLPVGWVFSAHLLDELFKFPLFHRRIWAGKWKHTGNVLT